jgi:Mrp family chromosome partitioning ATPase/capsule polysaccharide export protein KpsE/RkpR
VIVIEFSSEDPKLAAEIPNLIADTYIASQGNAKLESNAAATEWLAPEIEDLSKRVKEAEAKVAAYRGQSDILVGQNNSVLATQQLAELSSELSRLRASRAAAEATADSVRQALQNGGSLDALPEVMSSGLIQRLRERQIQLQSEITDLSTTLLDNHPRIRALRSQLTGLDAQIQSEARKVLSGLMTEAETAKARENQLLAEVNQLKAASARAGEQEVELNALEREAAAQRQLLETYLTRYREASARQDRNYLPVDARVFSRAVAPAEPYFPKVLPIVSAAFFGTILIMAIITLLRELFSGRAMRPAPVPHPVQKQEPLPEPAATALPVSIPFAATGQAEDTAKPLQEAQAQQAEPLEEPAESEPLPDPEPVMTSEIAEPTAQTMQEDPVVAEDVPLTVSEDSPGVEPALPQQIVTEMEPALMEEGPAPVSATPATRLDLGEVGIDTAVHKLIESGASRAVFVSPEGDEAAASAIMVARDIADAGLRVVLVDLTASGAVSGAMLESLTLPGITDLLAGDAQFTDVLHPDHFSDCHIMPVGVADPIRAMRAASRLPVILQSLAAAYDLVVVECGPTDAQGIRRLASSEAEVFISLLDPDDVALSAAANIIRDGFPDAILVTPVDSHTPRGPMPGTRAA